MLLVSTVSYKIVQEGKKIGPITPQRGLRQGDPLSPFLFLICAESLSAILAAKEQAGLIHGAQVARNAPKISHLFFADDSYLFFRANKVEAMEIQACLRCYEEASGQCINFQKSSLFYSGNTVRVDRTDVCNELGVNEVEDMGFYLGAPVMVGRSKMQTFGFLKDRIWKRINNWKEKFLSRAGKEILIKSVLQAIPTYLMSLFLMPKEFCENINNMLNRFWWNSGGSGSGGIHWKSWDKMCKPKSSGDLGFRNIHIFNLTLLAKQSWRIIHNPDSLVARILKARYFPNVDFLQASLGHNPSFIWRSILAGRDVLSDGLRRKIGTGAKSNIWSSPWIPDDQNPFPTSNIDNTLPMGFVKDLLNDRGDWNRELINNTFNSRDAKLILSIPGRRRLEANTWFWPYDKSGVYTIRSGYLRTIGTSPESTVNTIQFNWNLIWNLQVAPKVKNCLWRIFTDCLPTLSNLALRHSSLPNCCPICGAYNEMINHVFFECPRAAQVWEIYFNDRRMEQVQNFSNWLIYRLEDPGTNVGIISMISWNIWQARNVKVWDNKDTSPAEICRSAIVDLSAWRTAQLQKIILRSPVDQMATKWKKPQIGSFICNVDAGINNSNNFCSYGILLRDHRGRCFAARMGPLADITDPPLAEALTIREALSWVKDFELSHVEIQSDCLVVVKAIQHRSFQLSYLSDVIRDCCDLLQDMNSCSVSFVKRSANLAAHSLAKAVTSRSVRSEWACPPPVITDILSADLS